MFFSAIKSHLKWSYFFGFTLIVFYLFACIQRGNDFLTFYEVGKNILLGKSVYLPAPSTGMYVFYMPHFAVVAILLALLPFWLSATLWFTGKLYLFFWYLKEAFSQGYFDHSELRTKEKVLLVFPFLFLISNLHSDFILGQINLYIMFLLVLSFYFVSKGQNFVSAGCFVLASIKVTPMVFILWFVLKKKWTFLFYVILIFVGSYLVLHINSTNGIENEISAWLSLSTQMKAAKGELTLISNQSLVGAFSRILNSSKLGSLTAIGFGGFLILVVSGLTLMDRSEVGSFSLCFVLMLLLSPDTRSAHMVHLTIPMVFIFKCFVKRGGIDLFYLGSSFVAILFATQDLIGLRASNWALSNNLFTYYMMIIFGFCGYFILKSKVMVEKDIAKRPYQMLS